jgi:methionine synthase I (cobalamin-dependent)
MSSGSGTSLAQALKERVLVLNTSAFNPAWKGLDPSAWGGIRFEGSPNLNITRRELVLQWQTELAKAGSDVLETFSHGADLITAQEYGADRDGCQRWNVASVSVTREAACGQRLVIGAVGQSTDLLSLNGRHSHSDHITAYAAQMRDLWTAGIDAIHLAFFLDSRNLRAALDAAHLVEDELGCPIPVMITLDPSPGVTMLSGERPEELWPLLRDYSPIAVGFATYGLGHEMLRHLREVTDVPIGLLLDPCPWAPPSMTENRPIAWLAECLMPLLDEDLLSFCGLSCTVPSIEYVRAVVALVRP